MTAPGVAALARLITELGNAHALNFEPLSETFATWLAAHGVGMQAEQVVAWIAALTDEELSEIAQRSRAHPTHGYFDLKNLRAALQRAAGA
jgi:hypothetical protein